MVNTINMMVSKSKPLIRNPTPGGKYPRLEPVINFHIMDNNNKSDRGY